MQLSAHKLPSDQRDCSFGCPCRDRCSWAPISQPLPCHAPEATARTVLKKELSSPERHVWCTRQWPAERLDKEVSRQPGFMWPEQLKGICLQMNWIHLQPSEAGNQSRVEMWVRSAGVAVWPWYFSIFGNEIWVQQIIQMGLGFWKEYRLFIRGLIGIRGLKDSGEVKGN